MKANVPQLRELVLLWTGLKGGAWDCCPQTSRIDENPGKDDYRRYALSNSGLVCRDSWFRRERNNDN